MELHKIVNVKFRVMIKYNYTPAKPQRGKKNPAGFDLLQQTVRRSSGCSRPAVPPKSLSESRWGTGLQETQLREGTLSSVTLPLWPRSNHRLPQHRMLHKKVQPSLPVETPNFQEKAKI